MITEKTAYKPLSSLGMIRHYEWMLTAGYIKPGGPGHTRLKVLKQIYATRKAKRGNDG
tara:strand:- start:979 stop:1152 length:174 start_codon:yes stop_codon:yes gene_type:complete